ncbi:MAG: gamma-glutamyl-gamma-aminobutyrate hydrolase family protein, partial [Bacteroidetes bacterium]|nr:gamma-glutamyl-gamma-aminobutyrate hydrolase family protein [Bacteroidota bacterium]
GVATPIQLLPRTAPISANKNNLFEGLPNEFIVGRYHSWVVSDKNFPDALTITASESNGFIMALEHKNFDVQGVQFHPESVLTPIGETIVRNWLKK